MFIQEALAKSRYITRPEINGFLWSNEDEGSYNMFRRFYIDEQFGKLHSSEYPLSFRDLQSSNWVPLKVSFSVEELSK